MIGTYNAFPINSMSLKNKIEVKLDIDELPCAIQDYGPWLIPKWHVKLFLFNNLQT